MKRSEKSSLHADAPRVHSTAGFSAAPESGWFLPGLLLALCFALRFLYLVEFRDTPFYLAHLMSGHDQKTWSELAALIGKHPWHVDGRPFYQAPGYAYFLGAIFRLFGDYNYFAVGTVQALVDTAGAGLVFLLGAKLWNRRTGLAACALYAFYRPFIVYSVTVLSDSFILFANILCLFTLYRALDAPAARGRWLATGFAFGLAAVSKPTVLMFLAFSAAALLGLSLLPARRNAAGPAEGFPRLRPRQLARACLFFLPGFLLPVLPVVIRNSFCAGRFVTVATYGAVNWQIGNSADSIGLFMYPEGPLLSPLSRDFWRLLGRKTLLFFSAYEWPQNMSVYLFREITRVLKLPLFTLAFVMSPGLVGALVSRRRKLLFLHLYLVAGILTVVAFFVTARYRLPAVAGLILFAGGYLDFACRKIQSARAVRGERQAMELAGLAGSLLLLFALSFALINTWSEPLISEVYAVNYHQKTEKAAAWYRALGREDRARSLEGRFAEFARRYSRNETP